VSSNGRYCVYLLASRSRTLYAGITNNLKRRVLEHKEGSIPGFARKYRIHRLVYFEAFEDVHEALAWEKRVKSWRREKKVALIERHNSAWDDLAAGWYAKEVNDKQVPRWRSG